MLGKSEHILKKTKQNSLQERHSRTAFLQHVLKIPILEMTVSCGAEVACIFRSIFRGHALSKLKELLEEFLGQKPSLRAVKWSLCSVRIEEQSWDLSPCKILLWNRA